MANSYTKTYADNDALAEADLDSGFGSVQPSIDNMALATTGSTSGSLLKSNGSNVTPGWITPDALAASMTATGADAIASTMTSTGANAIFADIQATSSTAVCDAIVNQIDASIANSVIGRISSCANSAANIIVNAISTSVANNVVNTGIQNITSCSAAAANIIAQAETRSTGSTVSNLGVGMSVSSSNASNTTSSYTDVGSCMVSIVTSGRPVFVGLMPDGNGSTGAQIKIDEVSATADGAFKLLRDGSTIAILNMGVGAISVGQVNVTLPVGCIWYIDTPTAGTYLYKLQQAAGGGSTISVQAAKLVAYEL